MVTDAERGPSAQEPRRDPKQASRFWTVYTWVHVITWLLIGATLAVVLGGLLRLLGDKNARFAHSCLAFAFRCIVRLHPRYELTMRGLEHWPRGPALLCPNHQSLSDVVYLFSLPGQFKWVIKRELFKVPLFGAAMRMARYPAIARGDTESAMAVLSRSQELLQDGISILSFPEGTRSPDGELQRFQSGPARLAVAAQVPLVPIAILGTARLLPRGGMGYPADAHLVICIGKPIPTTGKTQRDVRALTRELREAVLACKAEAARVVSLAGDGWQLG